MQAGCTSKTTGAAELRSSSMEAYWIRSIWCRASNIAQALQGLPEDEFRLIYVDHRGVGRSDKPHEVEAYAMALRVADAVAVLEELGIERAHFIKHKSLCAVQTQLP